MIYTNSKILEELNVTKNIVIEPFSIAQVNPNSYDVKLNNKVKVYKSKILDCMNKKGFETKNKEIKKKGLVLYPGTLYLASTIEKIGNKKGVCFLEGKSSLARAGLSIHLSAGKGDYGFVNHWTMELTVVQPLIIYPEMRIAQIFFFATEGDPEFDYQQQKNSKYSEYKNEPVESKIYQNFTYRYK